MRDVVCSKGAVVAADKYGAQAGADILRKGGNAFDAAVATALAECVVQLHNVGLGGYAGTMVMYVAKEDAVIALDFDGRAPLASKPDMFAVEGTPCGAVIDGDGHSEDQDIQERGHLCVVAPPIVAGLAAVLERYGTMSFEDVALAAQKLAEEGFPVYPGLAGAMERFVKNADPKYVHALLPNGVPNVGDTLVQKDMADLMARLRKEGPEIFYKGDIPRAIVSAVRSGGGILDETDFLMVAPRFEEPVSIQSGDYEVFTPQPPAGGLTALQILNIMSYSDLTDSELGSAKYYHHLIEASKHAWQERFDYMADPLFADVPVHKMLSGEHARELWSRIETGERAEMIADPAGAGHTVHLVTADKDRNMVSMTATQGSWFGSFLVVEGLGMLLGNGMSRFDRAPGRLNSVAPCKRMQHNMSPLIITKNGRPYCGIGLPGGRKIVSVTALLAHALTRFGTTCGEAIDLPRFHIEDPEPAQVDSEKVADEIKREYGADYPVTVSKTRLGGPVAGVMLARETDHLMAASEFGPDCVATD